LHSGEAYQGEGDVAAAWRAGLAPDPALTCSTWSDRYRILSSRGSAEPGPYRTARTPYGREIMDVLSPSHWAQEVWWEKSAQIGATEIGNNWIGFCMDVAPGPILAVQPTVELGKRLSRQRIEPLIDESPRLRTKVRPARARDSGNTVLSKSFPGGQLIITGANSAVGLRQMPARYAFADEVDAYDLDVEGEGDPLALIRARQQTFGYRRKLFIASTPTIEGLSRVSAGYEKTDKRRYHVPCPSCGGLQHLQFERLRWQKGKPETVRYICEHCEEPIEEHHKTWMLAEENGACWRATAPAEQIAAARAACVVGFHISALYSPIGWLSWVSIARQWEEAQGDDAALKTFKNTVLGEPWQDSGEAPDWQRLYDRREQDWQLGYAPHGALLLTAGVDVQRDRLEVYVWGWGRGLRSFLVDIRVIEGDPTSEEVWDELTALLSETWPHVDGHARLGLAKLAIDAGDGLTTQMVYGWARRVGHAQVYPVKGRDGFDRATPVQGPTFVEATDGGRKIKRGVRLWTIAVAVFKSEFYRHLRLERPTDEELEAFAAGAEHGATWPAGYVHIPAGVAAEPIKQMTAERLVTTKGRKGFAKLEWRQMRDRNEALDCRVYARAAAWLLGADRFDDAKWLELESQLIPAGGPEPPIGGQAQRPRPSSGRKREQGHMGGRRPGWFDRGG
jgi:phage terminase large subunit GpA-like protein